MNIHLRLRRLRKARGLVLREVSEGTSLSISYLSDIEAGRSSPSVESAAKLAAFYGIALAELITGEPGRAQ